MNDFRQRPQAGAIAGAISVALATMLLSGCGGGGSNAGGGSITPPAPGATATVTSQQTDTTMTYGPVTLVAPAGSAPNGTELRLQTIGATSTLLPPDIPTLAVVGGTPALLTSSQTSLPGVLTISISYDPAHLTAAQGVSVAHTDASPEDTLRIATVVMQDGHPVWITNLSGNQVDKLKRVVSAQVPSFSGNGVYGLVRLAPPAPPANL